MSAVSNASEIASGDPKARRRMSTGQRILFFVTAWLIVLMPFLFWWNTWFGRQLSDKQVSEYLHDDKKQRHIQQELVQFGDATGRPQIRALLEPARITAPQSGRVIDASKVGTPIHQGGIVAKVENEGHTVEVRSPITGRLADLFVKASQTVNAGDQIATLDPGTDQVWEALRALYLTGQPEDIPAIQPYERELPDIPEHVRKQAVATEKAIRGRAK